MYRPHRLPPTEPPHRAEAVPSTIVLMLPARNEAATVADIVRRAPQVIAGWPVRVVVVDDGSTDSTAAAAANAGADVVSHDRGRGLGAAVRTGFARALTHHPIAVAFCDADGEYAPEELEHIVTPIVDGRADYVVGSRFTGTIQHMLRRRRCGNRVLTWALRRWTGVTITDGQSGYRALSARAAATVEIAHDYNYAQVMTCDLIAKGFGYLEVPITYTFRSSGRSFVRLIPYLSHVVPALVQQRRALRNVSPRQRGSRSLAAPPAIASR